jgi:hypothetical protein
VNPKLNEILHQADLQKMKNTIQQSEIETLKKEKVKLREEIKGEQNKYIDLNKKYLISQRELKKFEEEKSLKQYEQSKKCNIIS